MPRPRVRTHAERLSLSGRPLNTSVHGAICAAAACGRALTGAGREAGGGLLGSVSRVSSQEAAKTVATRAAERRGALKYRMERNTNGTDADEAADAPSSFRLLHPHDHGPDEKQDAPGRDQRSQRQGPGPRGPFAPD